MSECKLQNLKFVEWDISAVFVTTHPWTRASQRKILCSYEGPSWIWWNNFSLWVDLHSFEISPGRIERGSRLSLKSPKRLDETYKQKLNFIWNLTWFNLMLEIAIFWFLLRQKAFLFNLSKTVKQIFFWFILKCPNIFFFWKICPKKP